jgi:hypothetical protein
MVSQQSFSTQWPEAHCPSCVHASPLSPSPTHVPLSQKDPSTQSASVAQLLAQALSAHWV